MPVKPKAVTMSANSADVLNAIRNNASENYRDYVPVATNDNASMRAIGSVIMTYQWAQNEFLNTLVNRIGMVIYDSSMISNPLGIFKKGRLEFGETIEQIFVDVAKPIPFDVEKAESEVFKRVKPDVKSAFHIINYEETYKVTVEKRQLRRAFLSVEGVTNLVEEIIASLYKAATADEFLVTKYLVGRHLLKGDLYPVTVPVTSKATAEDTVIEIINMSNLMTFNSREYNIAGVTNQTPKSEQYLILNSRYASTQNVSVLAAAFNMDKVEFEGHHVVIDSFGSLDNDRLAKLFQNDPTYVPITDEEKAALDAIPGVIVADKWFMLYDVLEEMGDIYNPQGMYWNYDLNVFKTLSVSPFHNAAALIPGTPAVTSVTVSPATATVSAGQSVQLNVEVETKNFASMAVDYTCDNENVIVTRSGLVTVPSGVEVSTVIKVTATSVFDPSKSAVSTITVS